MLFVRKYIPCKLSSLENEPMEGFYIETYEKPNGWFAAPTIQVETILILT